MWELRFILKNGLGKQLISTLKICCTLLVSTLITNWMPFYKIGPEKDLGSLIKKGLKHWQIHATLSPYSTSILNLLKDMSLKTFQSQIIRTGNFLKKLNLLNIIRKDWILNLNQATTVSLRLNVTIRIQKLLWELFRIWVVKLQTCLILVSPSTILQQETVLLLISSKGLQKWMLLEENSKR